MGYETDRLQRIFEKTDGCCHLCHGRLTFSNYGINANSGWEVEHSVPKSKGGTDNLNNLFPAHVTCNRSKKDKSTRSARSANGYTRAPYNSAKKARIKESNTAGGAAVGGTVGLLFGPVGAIVGAFIGGAIGSASSPET